MEQNYKIYALFDKNYPDNIRYIGLTKNTIKERCIKHKTERSNPHKYNWIKKIGPENLGVLLLLDNLSQIEACENEIRLIKEYRELGYKLINIANGGEGWNDAKFTEEHKKNISKNHADVSGDKNPMFGRHHTIEVIETIRNKNKNYAKEIGYSLELREKFRKLTTGEGNPNSILNENQVLEIRKLFSEGNKICSISRMYGVLPPCISKIVKRLTWKHI